MLDFSGEDPRVWDPSGATTYMVNQMQEDLAAQQPRTQVKLLPIVCKKGVEFKGEGSPRGLNPKGLS